MDKVKFQHVVMKPIAETINAMMKEMPDGSVRNKFIQSSNKYIHEIENLHDNIGVIEGGY